MKKILVIAMVLIASSTTTFALNPSDYNAFFKLNNKIAFSGLVGYIDADKEQAAFLQHVFKVTEQELRSAVNKQNEVAADNVVNYNLRNTKCILSENQYRKYLEFVNVYLNNENNFELLTENK
jgi:hypothetical protein